MKVSQGSIGRVFVIRLDDGDLVPNCIEQFAHENGISIGHVIMVGGIGGGQVVVGPRESQALPPEPMLLPIDGAHEVVATGVLAPDETGNPILHIHGALGRGGNTMSGCLRHGVKTWLVGEVILYEIIGASAVRVQDPKTGFLMLEPDDGEASVRTTEQVAAKSVEVASPKILFNTDAVATTTESRPPEPTVAEKPISVVSKPAAVVENKGPFSKMLFASNAELQ